MASGEASCASFASCLSIIAGEKVTDAGAPHAAHRNNAAGLVLAFGLGLLAHRFRIEPLVGPAAGMLVGPFTPGFVADQPLAAELAEIGVILLMFGVGLHFSLEDLASVRAHRRPRRHRPDRRRDAMGRTLGLGDEDGPAAAALVFGLAFR